MYLSSMMLTNNHRDLAAGTGTSEGCRGQLCKVHPGRRYLAGNCSKASRWLLAGWLAGVVLARPPFLHTPAGTYKNHSCRVAAFSPLTSLD